MASIVNSFFTAPTAGQVLQGTYETVPNKYVSFSISIHTDNEGQLKVFESIDGVNDTLVETINITGNDYFQRFNRKYEYIKVTYENTSLNNNNVFYLKFIYSLDSFFDTSNNDVINELEGVNTKLTNINTSLTNGLSVTIDNHPETQTIDGNIQVNNIVKCDTDNIAGSVSVSNLPEKINVYGINELGTDTQIRTNQDGGVLSAGSDYNSNIYNMNVNSNGALLVGVNDVQTGNNTSLLSLNGALISHNFTDFKTETIETDFDMLENWVTDEVNITFYRHIALFVTVDTETNFNIEYGVSSTFANDGTNYHIASAGSRVVILHNVPAQALRIKVLNNVKLSLTATMKV